ncbi:MAG TPA: D-2-hydroxyacid dehydrogenase [Puia sp.]|jgi:glycerate dehydrogenase
MNIVVIDGHTLNPGDLSWDKIAALGKLTIYDRTAPADMAERCREADIVITNKAPISAGTLEQLPKLKMIAVTATGYNIVDTVVARKKDIVVSNVPAYGTASVAQHAFSLILELTNHVGANSASVAAGDWQKAPDWCYTVAPVPELEGKTLGIIGYGNIGQRMSIIAQAFGMKVLYYSPGDKPWTPDERADLPTLFACSDVVSLHAPLTANNEKFVNRELLSKMKPTAILINTARGPLINEEDLAEALNTGKIAGAGLDVLSIEPPTETNPLLKAKNCIITPHMSWISREARERIMEMTVANIMAFQDGSVINRVG